MNTYDQMSVFPSQDPGFATVSDVRLFPVRRTMSTFGLKWLEQLFFPTPQQVSSGWVRFGSKSNAIPTSAWKDLGFAFVKNPNPGQTNPYTGWGNNGGTGEWFFSHPTAQLGVIQTRAREWSRVSLSQIIADALSWYVYNHNVWYAEKLNLTVEELRAQQRALASAGLDRTSGPIVGVVGAVGSAINPAIGVVVGIINAIGKELLLSFINVSPDIPKPLFLRIPDPEVCEGRPEEQIDTDSGSSDDGTDEEEGISPLAVAGASALALLLLWAAKRQS